MGGAGKSVCKTLSRNDLGLTGSHQAGITVPKAPEILEIFPKLDLSIRNPEAKVWVVAEEINYEGYLRFICYNSKSFAEGTRNEYRLTGTTRLLRQLEPKPGDGLRFELRRSQNIFLSLIKSAELSLVQDGQKKLAGGWRTILKGEI